MTILQKMAAGFLLFAAGMITVAAVNQFLYWLTAKPRPQPSKHEAVRAIEFALTLDDHFERDEFLIDWLHGDTTDWPEFKP